MLDLTPYIRPGDRVLVQQGCGEPSTLVEALIAAHARVGPFETFVGPLFSPLFDGEAAAEMRFASYGAMGRAAKLARAGRLDQWPLHYSALDGGVARGEIRADVVLLHLARGPNGRLAAVLSNDFAVTAAPRARCVIAEVNARAPFVSGAEIDPALRIDLMIESDCDPVALPPASIGQAEAAIGAHVAALVPDCATIQTGIGAIPDAILDALSGHRDLGVHSGLIGDRVMDLMQRGVVTNAAKSLDTGFTVTNTIFGTSALYRFADGNSALRLVPTSYSHAHAIIAGQNRMTAINAAIEVDLAGNINAESVEGQPIGGTGGLVDFSRGARASDGGHAIVALRATGRTPDVARIVPRVATVTVAKTDADVIVTEYGAADLRNLGRADRAKAMIAIAAPQHREALERAFAEGQA